MSPQRTPRARRAVVVAIAALLAIPACTGGPGSPGAEQTLVVKAAAYNALPGQTDGQPRIAAWGDRLSDDMRVIAVSRDLLDAGLVRGTRVRIEGLSGDYVVLDKMASRWRNKIDIFMGADVEAARQWGVREVRIRWSAPR